MNSKVFKLQSSADYSNWSVIMQFWLKKEQLWTTVQNSIIKSESNITSAVIMSDETISSMTILNSVFEAWKLNNNKIQYVLILNISLQIQLLISNISTSHEMWAWLKILYQDQDFNHSVNLYNQLQMLQLSDCKDAHDYCIKFQITLQDLVLLSYKVGAQQSAANFLN